MKTFNTRQMTARPTDDSFDREAFLKTLTTHPGVYRMVGAKGETLYVGKAKNLKRRVSSYFSRSLNRRLQIMVSQTIRIEVTVTHTEAEALILENNLIKSLRPRYNVLLRDDKSYPYIYLSDDAFPRLDFHRGPRKAKGRYFGPYPSAGSTRATLQLLQKLFPVRQCENHFFQNRSRPCLQYQIKRCSAPCVGLVQSHVYQRDVRHAVMFLEGRANQAVDELVLQMEKASAKLEYEEAARRRDQIAVLRRIQERQYVSGESGDLDIVACVTGADSACVQVFNIRGGRNLGNRSFFPGAPREAGAAEIVSAFVAQHYLGRQAPKEIIVSERPPDAELLEQVLTNQTGYKVALTSRVRGERSRWLGMAMNNARLALEARSASGVILTARLESLRDLFGMDEMPGRLECFDISHLGGKQTVASCVVFDASGPRKSDYRRFNVEGIEPGDDYAAMEQVLTRRYLRMREKDENHPDIIFVDGGKGQVNAAARVLAELGIRDLRIVGVAKGPHRKPGMEGLFLFGRKAPIILAPDSPALHLIQQIRDEAHRFAITGHRRQRQRQQNTSVLEEIPGIGPKRRQRLLKQFGGLQELARAGIEDLARVDGISKHLARQIYDVFHGDG